MKKTLHIIKIISVWLLVIIAVSMMLFTVVAVNTFDRNNRDIFGYKAYIVRSDSMSTTKGDASKGHFRAGDLIFVKETAAEKLEVGDIISYISTNTDNYGETVTHMIRTKTFDATGKPGFVTYGTDTDTDDANIVTYDYILGKYEGHLGGVGRFFMFLKTTPGYIVCIFLPFLLLIVIQGINSIRLFKKYKAEQLAEIERRRQAELDELACERAEIQAERKRQEEMMQQLLKMQEALKGGSVSQQEPK